MTSTTNQINEGNMTTGRGVGRTIKATFRKTTGRGKLPSERFETWTEETFQSVYHGMCSDEPQEAHKEWLKIGRYTTEHSIDTDIQRMGMDGPQPAIFGNDLHSMREAAIESNKSGPRGARLRDIFTEIGKENNPTDELIDKGMDDIIAILEGDSPEEARTNEAQVKAMQAYVHSSGMTQNLPAWKNNVHLSFERYISTILSSQMGTLEGATPLTHNINVLTAMSPTLTRLDRLYRNVILSAIREQPALLSRVNRYLQSNQEAGGRETVREILGDSILTTARLETKNTLNRLWVAAGCIEGEDTSTTIARFEELRANREDHGETISDHDMTLKLTEAFIRADRHPLREDALNPQNNGVFKDGYDSIRITLMTNAAVSRVYQAVELNNVRNTTTSPTNRTPYATKRPRDTDAYRPQDRDVRRRLGGKEFTELRDRVRTSATRDAAAEEIKRAGLGDTAWYRNTKERSRRTDM